MQVMKRTNGAGLWALYLSLALVFASMMVATSQAQTSGTSSRAEGTLEDGAGPTSGDPDMPTGDTPPPSTGSGATGSIDNGTGMTLHSPVVAEPSKRYGAWAHWKLALKLYLRGFWLR